MPDPIIMRNIGLEKIERAKEIAVKFHGEQTYGDKPYEHHLQSVVNILHRFNFDPENSDDFPLFVSAWLHDSLEDTELEKSEIENEFGDEIADIVWRVTDEDGANRKERKAKTYLKLKDSEKAIILKLADRIANVESCLRNNSNLLQMYQKEHPTFFEKLRPYSTSEKANEMWEYLNKILEKEQVSKFT